MRWAISHTTVSLLLLCSQFPLAAQRTDFGAHSTQSAPDPTTCQTPSGKSVGPAQASWNQEDPLLPEGLSIHQAGTLFNSSRNKTESSRLPQIFRPLYPIGDPENPIRRAESIRSIPVSHRSIVDTRAHRMDSLTRRAVHPRRLSRVRQDWQVVSIPYTRRVHVRPSAAVYHR